MPDQPCGDRLTGGESGDPIYRIGWQVIGEDEEIAAQAKQLEKRFKRLRQM